MSFRLPLNQAAIFESRVSVVFVKKCLLNWHAMRVLYVHSQAELVAAFVEGTFERDYR